MKIGDKVYNINAPELGTFIITKLDNNFVYGIGYNGMDRGCLLCECKLAHLKHKRDENENPN